MRSTITFDNGTKFTRHAGLANQFGIQTYFCDPHSPWQKGGVENAIGRLRRSLLRKTDLSQFSTAQLDAIAQYYLYTQKMPRLQNRRRGISAQPVTLRM